jgi:hypothetical protein
MFTLLLIFLVPVWSGVNVAGVRLREINPNIGTENDPENWSQLHQEVVQRCKFRTLNLSRTLIHKILAVRTR